VIYATTLQAEGRGMNNILILALTIYLEAGNQGESGMRAVASVIHSSASFPCLKAYHNECLRPKRYSCWNNTIPSMDMVYKYSAQKGYDIAIKIAKEMALGVFKPTLRATNYCRTDVIEHTSWTNRMDKVAEVGEHTFYRKGENI